MEHSDESREDQTRTDVSVMPNLRPQRDNLQQRHQIVQLCRKQTKVLHWVMHPSGMSDTRKLATALSPHTSGSEILHPWNLGSRGTCLRLVSQKQDRESYISAAVTVFVTRKILWLAPSLTSAQTVPYDLLKRGYDNQICLDFSAVVVELMKSRHEAEKGVEWQNGDVRDMKDVESGSVDVAFDKGTLDAMIFGSPWSPPEETLENSGRYMKEVRLLHLFFVIQSKHGLTRLGSTSSERRWLLSLHHLPATTLHQTHLEP